MTLKTRITDDMKTAMKAKDSVRLGALRLLLAAIKQKEVDERIELDDAAIIAVLDKQLKQRRDSISQYQAAQRADLADKEQAEMDVFAVYLPQPLNEAEIDALIESAISTTGAADMGDMGKVMGVLRGQLAGRADMGAVSGRIKTRLAGR